MAEARAVFHAVIDAQPSGPEEVSQSRPAQMQSPETLPAETLPAETMPVEALIAKLREDRLWLLRQIDAGSWPEWRLDLAALERELGQLLEQAEATVGA